MRSARYWLTGVGAVLLLGLLAILALAPFGTHAQTGQYLNFPGLHSGWVEVPDDAGLSPTNAITIEAWVYLQTYTGLGGSQTDCPIIVGKNWETSYALSLACGGDVMDSFINGEELYSENHPIPLQTWTHIAMTYDGIVRRHYVNGELDMEWADQVGPIGDNSDPLRIGNDVGWDFSPNGAIDDVRIWNYVRSAEDIAANKDYVDPATPGLVAVWQFEGGSLTDLAHGHTGSFGGDVAIGGEPEPTPSPSPTPSPTASPTPSPSPTPTLSPTPLPTVPVPGNTPGDYDCDGFIAPGDAFAMLSELAGEPASGGGVCATGLAGDTRDANCDGAFDAQDPLFVLKIVAQMTAPAACPTPTPD